MYSTGHEERQKSPNYFLIVLILFVFSPDLPVFDRPSALKKLEGGPRIWEVLIRSEGDIEGRWLCLLAIGQTYLIIS